MQALTHIPTQQFLLDPSSFKEVNLSLCISNPIRTEKPLRSASKPAKVLSTQEWDGKTIQNARTILGELAMNFTDEELRDVVTEVRYLVENWMNEFEKNIFDGRTLSELINEKGTL